MKTSLRASVIAGLLIAGLLLASSASASVTNTLLTGSTGTVTLSLDSVIFNNDPAALPPGCTTTLGLGCNSDVTTGTSLAFTGGPLSVGEGIYVNNNDLTLTPPSLSDANQFLTFSMHPNLVFSLSQIGPGSPDTNCSALANFQTCSIFAGSPIVLELENGVTALDFTVSGKASDTGIAGLAGGSIYVGGFNTIITSLPNGMAPTPGNIQLFFCPSGTCTAADFARGTSLTSSQSGTFSARSAPNPTPEPGSGVLLGSGLLLLGLASLVRGKLLG